jgi:uncharacterized membrane protein HdeD (DUF308 family)
LRTSGKIRKTVAEASRPTRGIIVATSVLLLGTAILLYFYPQVAGYVLMAILGWIGIALIYRASKLYWKRNDSTDSH